MHGNYDKPGNHDAVVAAVAAACRVGDSSALRAVLAPRVSAVVDGIGTFDGHGTVGTLLLHPPVEADSVTIESVNGRPGLAYRRDSNVVGIVAFSVDHDLIDRLWVVISPDKLHHWSRSWSTLDLPIHDT